MKKVVICLLIILSFGLASCSAKPKEFSAGGVTITLTSDFSMQETDGVIMTCISGNVGFVANKESKSLYQSAGYYSMSNKDYAKLVLSVNKKTASAVEEYYEELESETIEYAYAYYTSTVFGQEYKYMLICMQNNTYYYAMNLYTTTDKFDSKIEEFKGYARTIRVS